MTATAMEQRCVKRVCDLATDAHTDNKCEFPSCGCEHELSIVRAVIDELRTPTSQMLSAAEEFDDDGGRAPALSHWNAILNAASPPVPPDLMLGGTPVYFDKAPEK